MDKEFKLASIFQDNLILQRDKPIRIFGECKTGIKIHIEFLDYRYEFHTMKDEFEFVLAPLPVITKPFDIRIFSEKISYSLKNCLVGDVFIFGGQSNMAFTVNEAINIERVEFKAIRFFEVPKIPYDGAEIDFPWLYQNKPAWLQANKTNIGYMNAIGYLVANKLIEKIDIPLGIISLSMGDTTIFTWIDEETQKNHLNLNFYWQEYQKELKKYISIANYEEYFKKQLILQMEFYGEIEKGVALGLSSEESHKRAYEKIPNPYPPMGPMHQNRPAGLFEVMVKKIIPYSTKAILYYQGENDKLNYSVYKIAMDALTSSWRKSFQDNLPIIIVQIAGYDYFDVEELAVPKFREAQQEFLNIEEKKYVVTASDGGERYNIHPKDKNKVAKRLANVLLEYVYHLEENSLSPQIESYHLNKDTVQIIIKNNPLPLNAIGKNGCFVGIDKLGNKISLSEYGFHEGLIEIKIGNNIKEIRYGYENYPELFIYSSNDLPLLPFRILL